jgi:hypothetical protein
MQFESGSGVIRLDHPVGVIGPRLRRSEFLESNLGAGARPEVQNPPWHSYVVGPTSPPPFLITLRFNGETLIYVELVADDPAFGSASWADWSEELEMARKAWHERWLAESGGSSGDYPWGSVQSAFDSRAGFSLIHLTYSAYEKRA